MRSLTADPHVRAVPWRDLVPQSYLATAFELTLSLPWLSGALACEHLAAQNGRAWYLGALLCSFWFFLTALRQAHNAQHYTLGLSRRVTDGVLLVLSVLMVSSLHAIQATHLHHHKHCLDDQDVEASTAHLPWYRALIEGPRFIANLHLHGLRLSRNKPKRLAWIMAELAAIAVWGALVFWVLDVSALKSHFLIMAIGQCMTGFFAVWTVHHGCDANGHLARTQRGWFKNFISYGMFFHLEHHLFPGVPTRRLPELARRLDAIAPHLRSKLVY